jgi:hypothetical protein
MQIPRAYADFNGIEYDTYNQPSAAIDLTGYGTIASLANQKIRLKEGMVLVLCEPNDIEVKGTAYFDHTLIDPAGRMGKWMARINAKEIKDCEPSEPMHHQHFCSSCEQDLIPHLKEAGQLYKEFCPRCGTSVMAPLAPPEDAY